MDRPRRTRQAADSGAGAVEDPVRLAGAKRPRRGGKLAALANLVSVVEEPDLAVGQPVAAAAPAAAVPAAAAAPPVAPAALPAPAVLSDPPQPKPALVIETDDPIIRSNEAEMFSHFCMVEEERAPDDTCLRFQPHLTPGMRAILLDWLVEVARRFRQAPETVFQAASLVDRFLATGRVPVTRDNFQCYGSVCLVLASKIEEAYRTEVTYEDLTEMCAGAYSKAQLASSEAVVLSALGFHITGPTGYIFLTRLQRHLILQSPGPEAEAICLQAQFLLERCLLELPLTRDKPSRLAATATFMALRTAALAKAAAAAAAGSGQRRQAALPTASAVAVALFTPPHHHSEARPQPAADACIGAAAAVAEAVWTPVLAGLSGFCLAEVVETAAAIQTALGSGIVVAHNVSALAKEAAAKASAARAGGEAASPKAYSHFQMEAVARKYAKPEVLEVSRLPIAVECSAAPAACPALAALPAGGAAAASFSSPCCCAAGLHLVTIGNIGFVPWVTPPPPPALFTPVSAPGGSKGGAGPAASSAASAATEVAAASHEGLSSPPGSLPSTSRGASAAVLRALSTGSQATLAADAPMQQAHRV